MKRYLLLLAALLIMSAFTAPAAPLVDAEGYPVVYLRGEISSPSWGAEEDLRFLREGDSYSLYVDRLDGQFKIADAEWRLFDYGAIEGEAPVVASSTLLLAERGANFRAEDLSGVTLSFDVVRSGDSFYASMMTVECGTSAPSPLSGTLPVLYINVYKEGTSDLFDNAILSKDLPHKDYFSNATYWLDLNGCEWLGELGATSVGSSAEPLALEIKARGNYTRTGFAKKPFKLKLGKKQNLLGLTPEKSKHYALLAHADDHRGFLRNFTGFDLGHRIGLPWTPSQQPVEVVINGDYRGLYFLTESVRVGDGRVEIEPLADNEERPDLLSGGYVVELDNYDEENQIRFKEKPSSNGDPWVRVTFDTPESYSPLQLRFVGDQFRTVNDLIGSNDHSVWSYLDLDDAARYYLVKEIISDTEAFHGSTYLFRDRGEGEKWHFSPLWDCGNAFNGSTESFLYSCGGYGNTWIHTLAGNGMFADCVQRTWLWFMSSEFDGLYADMDEYCLRISAAAKADRRRWRNAPLPNSGNATPVADNSDMPARCGEVKEHLRKKIDWLKGRFGDFSDRVWPEPERDTTPAASLPDYLTAGAALEPAEGAGDEPLFYSLQGIAIPAPVPGEAYIRVEGGKAEKLMNRR